MNTIIQHEKTLNKMIQHMHMYSKVVSENPRSLVSHNATKKSSSVTSLREFCLPSTTFKFSENSLAVRSLPFFVFGSVFIIRKSFPAAGIERVESRAYFTSFCHSLLLYGVTEIGTHVLIHFISTRKWTTFFLQIV